MEAVMFTLPIAVGIGLIFLSLFYWAWKTGQFENMEGPAERAFHDDDDEPMQYDSKDSSDEP